MRAGATGLVDAEGFQSALYAVDIGQNDLAAAFTANLSYAHVLERIPSVVHEIRKAIEASLISSKKKIVSIADVCRFINFPLSLDRTVKLSEYFLIPSWL